MMGYRGEDLDLRTPQMGTRPLADLTNGDIGTGRQRAYGARGETIWVDDTVLACLCASVRSQCHAIDSPARSVSGA